MPTTSKMQPLGLNEIRELFLSFFETKAHIRLKSHSLVPENDKSLLIINSGMAPLKPYFTGRETPPSKRVVTCQKCIRTGDIDIVGKTARHGTFFEMLGNFSFGDYFKKEIIPWSWEFVTEWLKIPVDKLYVTVYLDDDEAFDIWAKDVGVPVDRIFRMGKEDNFWEVGLGPCGPCSEIYFDRGPSFGREGFMESVTADEDRYMEFWNLVFTQFCKEEDGSYSKLAHPNIDTGMGLERIAVIMQEVYSLFDIDTIKAIRDCVCEKAGISYGQGQLTDISVRIVTDHTRSVAFMLADGILPSNEGRGYVLRRLLRRASRHGKLLGIEGKFLADLVKIVINMSKDAYPELEEKSEYITKLMTVEENRFHETIDAGLDILMNFVKKLRETLTTVLSGEDAFRLYDTFGFPLELTEEVLAEAGFTADRNGFEAALELQREKARSAREESTYNGSADTVFNRLPPDMSSEFVGYEKQRVDNATILAIIINDDILDEASEGDSAQVIVDITPIYAESGGQAGDRGSIRTETGLIDIVDCIKAAEKFVHIGKVVQGRIATGQTAVVETDAENRLSIARNHSATHLLQKALRQVLGTHVEQAGSLVSAERLRFDFTHFSPVTGDEIRQIEEIVNDAILSGLPITTEIMTPDTARKKGAMALFGEKYKDNVRVVSMGDFSLELCGGTHLSNTAQAGTFKIVSETGVAAGVRRIEGLTGKNALNYYRQLEDTLDMVAGVFRSTRNNIVKKAEQILSINKEQLRAIESLEAKLGGSHVEEILRDVLEIGGLSVVKAKLAGMDIVALRALGDKVRDKLSSGVIILAGEKDGKASMVVMATEDLTKSGVNAGTLIKAAAQAAGGGGGGRPSMAQAGLKDASKTDAAIEAAIELLRLR